MSTVATRISKKAHRSLRGLSERLGEPMQVILDRAVEEYRRKCFLAEANAAFAALRAKPAAWKKEQEERAAWEDTVQDGLEDK